MKTVETLVWEVRRLFRELGQAADRAMAPLGITAAERALLEFLAREKGPVSISSIARKRAVSRQHVHQTLARLDHRWVDRATDPEDRRAVVLKLSRDGQHMWKRIQAADARFLVRLEQRLDGRKIRAASATLRKIRAELGAVLEE